MTLRSGKAAKRPSSPMSMSKILDEPIGVALQAGHLVGFTYRKRYRVCHILDSWSEAGDWWLGDSEKSVYRIETTAGTVCEIYHRQGDQRWFLYKIYD